MSRDYPCVYYYGNGRCKKFEEPGYIDYCVLGPCKHETPSNADRIRAMSDEELAEWMAECNAYRENAIASQWLPWLKQPAFGDER